MKCEFGCGKEATNILKNGKYICLEKACQCSNYPGNIKVPCKYCQKEISFSGLNKHQQYCSLNPLNVKYCRNCNKILSKKGLYDFCSKSCSAIYNNKLRKQTIETKAKISNSLRRNKDGFVEKKPEEFLSRSCISCGKDNIKGKLYCSKCIGIKNKNNLLLSRLSFIGYEKRLGEELKKIYGDLKKEIINDIAFDYCNNKYIIEFSFDKWQGATCILKRFLKVTDDNREKVAYIPEKYLGPIRRKRLENANIKILYSDEYIKFHTKPNQFKT
jgi:hypothetical protein